MLNQSIGRFVVIVPYERFKQMLGSDYFVCTLRRVAACISEWNNLGDWTETGTLFLGDVRNSKRIVRSIDQPRLSEVVEVVKFEGDIPNEYVSLSDCKQDLGGLATFLATKLELPAHRQVTVECVPAQPI